MFLSLPMQMSDECSGDDTSHSSVDEGDTVEDFAFATRRSRSKVRKDMTQNKARVLERTTCRRRSHTSPRRGHGDERTPAKVCKCSRIGRPDSRVCWILFHY